MLSLHRHTGNLQTHICNFTYNRALVIFSLQKTTNLLTIITNLCRQPRCNCPSCKPPFGSWDCNVSSRPPSCLWQWCNCGGDGDVDFVGGDGGDGGDDDDFVDDHVTCWEAQCRSGSSRFCSLLPLPAPSDRLQNQREINMISY